MYDKLYHKVCRMIRIEFESAVPLFSESRRDALRLARSSQWTMACVSSENTSFQNYSKTMDSGFWVQDSFSTERTLLKGFQTLKTQVGFWIIPVGWGWYQTFQRAINSISGLNAKGLPLRAPHFNVSHYRLGDISSNIWIRYATLCSSWARHVLYRFLVCRGVLLFQVHVTVKEVTKLCQFVCLRPKLVSEFLGSLEGRESRWCSESYCCWCWWPYI